MPGTPAETVRAHMEAINRREPQEILATSSLPLIQMWPTGERTIMATPEDMLPVDALGPEWSRTDIDELTLLDTSGDVVVYRLTFTRIDRDGKPTLGTHRAHWGVCREGDGWRVAWRQYLGPI